MVIMIMRLITGGIKNIQVSSSNSVFYRNKSFLTILVVMAYININLKCVTFNCFRFKNSSSFINSLCEPYDRCFLNEHFLKPYEIATVKEELKERNLWSF